MLKTLGKNPSGDRLVKTQQSANYISGAFSNQSPTEVTLKDATMVKMMREYSKRPKDTAPSKAIPFVSTNLKTLAAPSPTIVWFGHSSYLIKSQGVTILVDPVFSGNASPFSFFAKAFDGANNYGVEDFDTIDVLLLTHDHYDHLDYKTVTALAPKVKQICTSLGVASHLEYWGIPAAKITELDWWQEGFFADDIKLTAAPARHFSGRSFKRAQTLWSSFVLNLHGHTLYLGGDSGYDNHFKTIGDKFGGFDIALLENGQYGKNWPYIHMLPEQTLQAANDLGAKVLMPVHWAKFTLALHPWNEPIKRLMAAKDTCDAQITTPQIGEPVVLGSTLPNTVWWDI